MRNFNSGFTLVTISKSTNITGEDTLKPSFEFLMLIFLIFLIDFAWVFFDWASVLSGKSRDVSTTSLTIVVKYH